MKEAIKDSFISVLPLTAALLLGSFLLFFRLYLSPFETTNCDITTELYYSSLKDIGLLVVSLKDPEKKIEKLSDIQKKNLGHKLTLLNQDDKIIPYSLSELPTGNDEQSYSYMYTIPVQYLKENKKIIVKLKVDDAISSTSVVEIPQNRNRTGLQNLMDAVNISAMLGNSKETLKFANILIKHFPDSPNGYFYQGIGYEFENKKKLASDAYREAQARTKTTDGEIPPYLMFKRFTLLENNVAKK